MERYRQVLYDHGLDPSAFDDEDLADLRSICEQVARGDLGGRTALTDAILAYPRPRALLDEEIHALLDSLADALSRLIRALPRDAVDLFGRIDKTAHRRLVGRYYRTANEMEALSQKATTCFEERREHADRMQEAFYELTALEKRHLFYGIALSGRPISPSLEETARILRERQEAYEAQRKACLASLTTLGEIFYDALPRFLSHAEEALDIPHSGERFRMRDFIIAGSLLSEAIRQAKK